MKQAAYNKLSTLTNRVWGTSPSEQSQHEAKAAKATMEQRAQFYIGTPNPSVTTMSTALESDGPSESGNAPKVKKDNAAPKTPDVPTTPPKSKELTGKLLSKSKGKEILRKLKAASERSCGKSKPKSQLKNCSKEPTLAKISSANQSPKRKPSKPVKIGKSRSLMTRKEPQPRIRPGFSPFGKPGRKLYVMRHGERIDRIFPDWTSKCFDKEGNYKPTNLNELNKLLKRKHARSAYQLDPPLSAMGKELCKIIGAGYKQHGADIDCIFCSPSLRCLQSAAYFMKGQNVSISLNIEPGLFEWTGWYENKQPVWLTNAEIADQLKVRINNNYIPFTNAKSLFGHGPETIDNFYKRTSDVIDFIVQSEAATIAKSILVMTHGIAVDVTTRRIRGLPMVPPDESTLKIMGTWYPYLCCTEMEERGAENWWPMVYPLPPLSHLDYSNRIDTTALENLQAISE